MSVSYGDLLENLTSLYLDANPEPPSEDLIPPMIAALVSVLADLVAEVVNGDLERIKSIDGWIKDRLDECGDELAGKPYNFDRTYERSLAREPFSEKTNFSANRDWLDKIVRRFGTELFTESDATRYAPARLRGKSEKQVRKAVWFTLVLTDRIIDCGPGVTDGKQRDRTYRVNPLHT